MMMRIAVKRTTQRRNKGRSRAHNLTVIAINRIQEKNSPYDIISQDYTVNTVAYGMID